MSGLQVPALTSPGEMTGDTQLREKTGMDTWDSEERERCQKEGSRTELEQDVG